MLEKLVKKLALPILTGTLLFTSACATYKTISENLIQPVKPVEINSEEEIPDYSKLTWQEAINYVQTPQQAQYYLNTHLTYDNEEAKAFSIWIPGIIHFSTINKGESFAENHKRRKGVCLDYATCAAALLSDNGYPPLVLITEKEDRLHAIFLYKTKKGFGTLGTTPYEPIYPTVKKLLEKNSYIKNYKIVDLTEAYRGEEWIFGDVDIVKNLPKPND